MDAGHAPRPASRPRWAAALVLTLLATGLLPASHPTSAAGEELEELRWTTTDNPVMVEADLALGEGTRLVIEAGVEVRLGRNVSIEVRGELRVEGTASAPVRFVPNGTVMPDFWNDVRIHSQAAGGEHVVRWAVFLGGDAALSVAAASVLVEDCTFRTCRYGILSRAGATMDVRRCLFENNTALGLEFETGSGGTARDCTFLDNNVGVYCYEGVEPMVVDCEFDGNYHHLSFARDANATVRRCHLSNATAELFECYWNSSPRFEEVTFDTEEDPTAFLRDRCRPTFVGGTPASTLSVDTSDGASYAVAVSRITIRVVSDRGKPLEGANVTLRGASGDLYDQGTTGADGRLTGGFMAFYSVGDDGPGDQENPHRAEMQWGKRTGALLVTPRDLTKDMVLVLELQTSPPEPAPIGWVWWFTLVLVLAVIVGAIALLARRGRR